MLYLFRPTYLSISYQISVCLFNVDVIFQDYKFYAMESKSMKLWNIISALIIAAANIKINEAFICI